VRLPGDGGRVFESQTRGALRLREPERAPLEPVPKVVVGYLQLRPVSHISVFPQLTPPSCLAKTLGQRC
jgi:hypothetical protein